MPDGTAYNEHSIESTSPTLPTSTFDPSYFRPMLQRQMDHTANRIADQLSLSIGDFDGRFLGQFPGQLLRRENDKGELFHLVGINYGGDLSVAAP